jgi:hypothetical protein
LEKKQGPTQSRSLVKSYHDNQPRGFKEAALAYASRGVPVFPGRPGSKEPLTPHGFKDASVNPGKITAWWNRWPNANICIPTGEASGIWVLDVDGEEGRASLATLELKHGPLPQTTLVETGGGGAHYYFPLPPHEATVKNSNGQLGSGLDVRGEGGYILAPPSVTERPYRTIEKRPLTQAGWLLGLVTAKPKLKLDRSHKTDNNVNVSSDTELIPEGRRNDTLARLAGRLHDGTRTLADLTAKLLAINEARCTPPLPKVEVLRIASSIFSRLPCSPSKETPGAVIGVLADLLDIWWRTPWPGIGGKSRRDAVLTWIVEATQHGTLTPDGDVALSISRRQTAEKMRTSVGAAQNAFVWARQHGWVRGGANGPNRKDGHASGIVLIAPHNARKVEHSPPQRSNTPLDGRGVQLCALPTSRRGRHSAPGLKREATKSVMAVVDHLERAAAWLGEDDIAQCMGVSRGRDVRRRYLEPLEGAGVAECTYTGNGRLWRLADGWEASRDAMFARDEALERAAYSGMSSDERQRERHGRERDGYRNRYENKPDISPSTHQLAQGREGWKARTEASGEIAELEPLSEPPSLSELYALLNQPVLTNSGRGRLWQAFEDRVGVVLDKSPDTVVFLNPVDVLGAA